MAVYGQTLFSTFHFDDRSSILENPALTTRSGNISALWRFWPTRFLTSASFFFNYRLAGFAPFSYHLINTLIHAANAVLLYLILLLSWRKSAPATRFSPTAAAGLGALLFALHPVQTQAVSYLAQRATILAAFFSLLSLFFYIRGQEKKSLLRFGFAWLMGAGAMLCKEIAFILPPAIILWDCIFTRKPSPLRRLRWGVFSLLLLIIPAIVWFNPQNPKYNDSGQISFLAGKKNYEELLGGIRAAGRNEYAVTQIRVIVTYLRLVWLPVRQNLDYDYPIYFSFYQNQVILASLILLLVIISTFFLLIKKKLRSAFGIFFFLLALIPESSVIPIRDVIFEHRLYLPLVGAAFLLMEEAPSSGGARRLIWVVLALFALMTVSRNRAWKDEITLWVDTVTKSPGKARPRNNLGYIYNQAGLYREARKNLKRALELWPSYAEAMVNLAISHKNLDQLDQAEEVCREALRLKDAYPEGHNCLAEVLRLKGKLKEAEQEYLRALELNPLLTDARNNLANLYQEMGRKEEAEREYQKIVEKGGENPTYLNNLGLNLLEQGEIERAISAFRRALALDGKLPQAHYNLGNALFRKGDLKAAASSYLRAVELKPDYARAYYNLGVICSQLQDWDQALKSFIKVTELEPGSPEAHLRTGLILALYKNQPDAARRHLQQALKLNPELPERRQVEELLRRLTSPGG